MQSRNIIRFPAAKTGLAFPTKTRRSNVPKSGGKAKITIGWPAFSIITSAACLALFAAIWFSGGAPASQSAVIDPYRTSFGICFGPSRYSCVVDGDTFWFEGSKIRISDINTPEISRPGCAAEKRLGDKAKYRLQELLNAGSFDLEGDIFNDKDKYGRDLRVVTRGGESLGQVLVSEGLAEEWQGYRRNWC